MAFRTRFAPSPTGPLHLGHAYSALVAHDMARAHGGVFLLRIEDIDRGRSRRSWEEQIFDDLSWLGITWDEPVMRQSERSAVYAAALQKLWLDGLAYPCSCTRRDIAEAVSAPQEGSLVHGPDGVVYPGTCRNRRPSGEKGNIPPDTALRLEMEKAIAHIAPDTALQFNETRFEGPQVVQIEPHDLISGVGDIVLSRRDMGTSYHLSVVVDDADQGITHVVRGEDLFEATKIHVVLQKLLDVPTPVYHHHSLIRDDAGKRLAKRDDARALQTFRREGATPDEIRTLVGL